MQANKNIHLCWGKHLSTSYSAAKHPKHNKFATADTREKPVDFFLLLSTGIDSISFNNFANIGSFAKVSIPGQSIIPWFE